MLLKTILTSISAYISTGLDYLVILMTLFRFVKLKKDYMPIFLGDLIGSYFLIFFSLIAAFFVQIIPAEWVIGLLGLIPIYIGIKIFVNLIRQNEDDEISDVNNKLNNQKSLLFSVIIITITTCGADNIGIYVPLFAQLDSLVKIIITLLTFFFMITLFFVIGLNLMKFKIIYKTLENYGDYISGFIYILLGILILFEAGTVSHIINLII